MTAKQELPLPEFFRNLKVINEFLNQPPKEEWVKDHPFATRKVNGEDVPVKYIPIGIIEDQLREVFEIALVTIKDYKQIGDSISMTITLKIPSFINQPQPGKPVEWLEMDGAGAYPIFPGPYGVQLALPGAKSFAVKDAAEMFGKRFGSDLNRAEIVVPEQPEPEVTPNIRWEIAKLDTPDAVTSFYQSHPELHSNIEFANLLKEKRSTLWPPKPKK